MFTPQIKKLVDPIVLDKFEEVKQAIQLIPEVKLPSRKSISCHMVCRLLAKQVDNLILHDGYFKDIFQHSWLTFGRYIIDPYPIGVIEVPILFETGYLLPWGEFYKDSKLEVITTVSFEKDMKFLVSKLEVNHVA